ncbi:TPA: DUF6572 domain-containing protein [Streptococcus suis]
MILYQVWNRSLLSSKNWRAIVMSDEYLLSCITNSREKLAKYKRVRNTIMSHNLHTQRSLSGLQSYIEHCQKVVDRIDSQEGYGDDFTEKVIKLTFQYAPSDNGLAFLVQVQKVLQPTDIRLKVVVPE